ncbi:MAG: helix-turn-helix domain-containing protein [Lachnospiraceae bacterium]|nr:helix-turn-helix domain-containing protein [Lachnospiraceae bacterium]
MNTKIKKIRIAKGLTQQQLGDLCDPPVAGANIRKYENGKQTPKLSTLQKIAAALGVSPFDLIDDEYLPSDEPIQTKSASCFLESFGYDVSMSDQCYIVSGHGISVALSQDDYLQLQSSSSDLIYAFLWKKQHPQN